MINLRSKLRQRLLAYYFTNPSAEHHLRELARLLGVQPSNLSRELQTLTRDGVFVSRTSGRQKYFRLNRKHPIYDETRKIIFKTVGLAGQLREALAHTLGVGQAYVYGSFARDQQDTASDLDLLIIGVVRPERLEEKIGKLERLLRREINYTLMSPAEFKSRRAQKDPFLEDVFRHKRISLLAS